MSELRSALDGLADVDFGELSDAALLDLVSEWSSAVNRMTAALTTAALTTAVRAAERREAHAADGAASMKAWLRGMCRLAPGEAAAIVSTGRRLEQLPATTEAFAAAAITATHPRVLTRAMTPSRVAKAEDAGIELVETDQILAGLARDTTPEETAGAVALARGALDGGTLPDVRGERPHVRVSIDWMALCAARGSVGVAGGDLGWAGPITPETARRLACDASVARIITGPDGLPLDVGRPQRTASAAIRRPVVLRDGHCAFAGCDAPPEWCDVHHVVHWALGGATSYENGALLCERHHTSCHEGGIAVRRDPGSG